MLKTMLMLAGLAAFTAASTACSGLFSGGKSDKATIEESCGGLEGQARIDCEKKVKAAEQP